MTVGKKLSFLAILFAQLIAALTQSCSKLSSTNNDVDLSKVFAGVTAVTPKGDGTYQVSWGTAKANGDAVYKVYALELLPGTTPPKPEDIPESLMFGSPAATIPGLNWLSSVLTFKNSTCFAVRVSVGNVSDTNKNIKCTNHEKFVFPGVQSLGIVGSGKFRLAWPAVTDAEAKYSVYAKTSSTSYNFSAEPLLKTQETLVETKAFPLNYKICFVVRSSSKNSPLDQNTNEVCSTDDGVADFKGINSVVSSFSGQAVISWVKSVSPNVKGYRIYEGNSFQRLLREVSASLDSATLGGLPPGDRLDLGVRMLDATGREDDNIKTISVVVSDAQVLQGTFAGCASASTLDTKRISVAVTFPDRASAMRIYRDGLLAGTLNAGTTQLIDQGLSEGTTYAYSCEALIDGLPTAGTAKLTASTSNVNPPNFAGLKTVARVGTGTVKLSWDALGDGPKAKNFKVYMVPGTTAPTLSSTTLVSTLSGDLKETTVSSLGDELRYTFVVTACSVTDICAGQTVSVSSGTLQDEGFPKTPGATSARMQAGKAIITAPWMHSMGAVAKRKIYQKNPSCSSAVAFPNGCVTINNFKFEFKREEVVADLYQVPPELEVSGLSGTTSYSFVVWDEDPSGNINSDNAAVVTVNSGDITAPSFSGIGQLVAGSLPESQLQAVFTAIDPEGSGAGQSVNGASSYLVYVTDSAPAATPADACSSATPTQQISALVNASNSARVAGESVTVTLIGLTPRRKVNVCVKARDSATNVSATTTSLTATTGDRTAPVFGGVQTLSYNTGTARLQLNWNSATSPTSDVREYRITVWRCPASLTLASGGCPATSGADVLNTTRADNTTNAAGIGLANTELNPVLASNDRVSVRVEACDSAAPDYASADNCTTSGRILNVTLPDVDPPAGFLGISSAAPISATQGAIRVGWAAPSPASLWSDYVGFKVYTVASNESLTLVRDCVCTANNCLANPMTTCDITGLDARRTFNFFARAYDAVGNLTAVPAAPSALARSATTNDTTPPTFAPNLNASFVNTGTTAQKGVSLSWDAATDNQYSGDAGNVVTYRVFRSMGAAFVGLGANTVPSNGSQLLATTSLNYVNLTSNLTASSTDYYVVCAVDSSSNVACDPAAGNGVRSVAIPRLAPPVFSGISTLDYGTTVSGTTTLQDTTLSVGYTEIISETASPSAGAYDYQIFVTEAVPPASPANACTDTNAVLKSTRVDSSPSTLDSVTTVIAGLTPRRTYSVCVKARDSLGNLSATAAALTKTTLDITPPTFGGLQNAVYNGSTNQIDLTWVGSTSSDLKDFRIKIWKMISSVAQTPSIIVRTAASAGSGTSLAKSDFPFASNDTVRMVVQACDNAAPDYNTTDNCTAFADSSAREIVLPDVDPPTGFAGITAVADTTVRSTGAIKVTWASMGSTNPDWADIRGFRIYNVTNPGTNAMTLLKDCACIAYGCTEKLTTCDLTGLDAGRTYSLYVRAYDNAPNGGNESLILNPNPIGNVRNFRTADLVAPTFVSNLTAAWNAGSNGIAIAWNAATDNQYSAEAGNTVGYRLYRKTGSIFSATTRAAYEAEGSLLSLSPDTSLGKLDAVASLADGQTYYYAVCAFDREPTPAAGAGVTGNTTCDSAVRNATVPDVTAPVVATLAAKDGANATVTSLTRAAPLFNLSWSLSDNVTASNQIFVKVRRKMGTTSADFPLATDALSNSGAGLALLSNEQGTDNLNGFLNYLITAEDTVGNASSVTFSIASNRAALPTVMGSPDVSVVNAAGAATIPITYSGASSILASAPYLAKATVNVVSASPGPSPSCTLGYGGSGLGGRTITLQNCSGNGTVTLSLAAGTATDAQSNGSSVAGPSNVITVDNTAPTVAILVPGASAYTNSTSAFTVSGTCSENGRTVSVAGSGVATGNTPTCTSGAFSTTVTLNSGDGSKAITATQTDAAGNTNSAVSASVTLDMSAPVVTVSYPSFGAAGQTGIIFSGSCETGLSVFFNGAGVSNAPQIATCSAGVYTTTVSFTSGEGNKVVNVSQVDLAGNTSVALSRTVVRDQTLPTISFGSVSPSVVKSTGTASFVLTFSDNVGVDSVTLASSDVILNSTGTASCSKAVTGSGTSTRTVTLSSCTGNGSVTISLPANVLTDTALNNSAAAGPSGTALTVDNTAPVVAFTSPANSSSVQSTFTLAGTCESGAVVILSAVTPTSTACSSGTFSQSVTIAAPDGAKTVTATQTDSAGNTSSAASLSLTRDTVAPALALASNVSGQVFVEASSAGNIITGTCESGLNVVLSGNVTGQTVACSASSFSFSSVAFTVGDGSKTVTVTETDLAGNSTTRSTTVTLDTTKSASINSPNWTGHINGLNYIFSGSCISTGYSYAATSTVGTARSISCTGGALAINARLNGDGTGLTSGSVTVTGTNNSNASQTSSTTTFTYSMPCPSGFVGVPGKWSGDSDTAGLGNVNASAGNADAGLDPTKDFCVMKYPAKAATSNNGGQSPWEEIYDGNKTFTMANIWPQSRAAGTPWVNISRNNAVDRCKALNEAYGLCSGTGCYTSYSNTTQGFRLMSNTEWQVVARNMENTGANWTSGTVGTGYLWRGHSDNAIGANTDLHSQTFNGASQLALSNPRFDGATTDYFGTGNNVTQNSTGTAGWQERRRFVLSSGASVWDMSGNVSQLVSDDNSTGTGTSGELGLSSGPRSSYAWWDFNNVGFTSSDRKLFGSSGGYISNQNTGKILVSPSSGVFRGGNAGDSTFAGIFAGRVDQPASAVYGFFGFRCAFIPPPLPATLDTGVPTIAVQRTTSTGTALGSNGAINITAGGFWHLGFSVSDAENTGTAANNLWIQVRRKIATGQTNSDYPTLTDAVYREGYLPAFQLPNTYAGTAAYGLADETAWTLDPTTLQYTRNDGKYVNYLVTVIDPSGNKSDATVGNGGTLSITNTQSCPQGYVGVPGMNGSGSAWNDPAVNAGLGNVNATAGNSNKGLDISSAFCVMKFPAKIQSANTTVAASYVGGKLEPIANGNQTFSQVSTTYANAAAFDTNIRYIPDSRPTGTPWVNISRDDSILACRSLQMAYLNSMPDTSTGTGFQLISNTQWQMLARNAENQASNWSNNAVGSGVLSRGHSDNEISATEVLNSWCFGCSGTTANSGAPNSINDINAYFATGAASSYATWNTLGTSPAAGAEQRRNNFLSNSAVVRDVGGNVWQWVSDNNNTGTGTSGELGLSSTPRAANTWWEFDNAGLTTSDKKLFGSFGGYTSSVNAGKIHGASAGAVFRGSSWSYTTNSGLYSAFLIFSASQSHPILGFRCAFVP